MTRADALSAVLVHLVARASRVLPHVQADVVFVETALLVLEGEVLMVVGRDVVAGYAFHGANPANLGRESLCISPFVTL